MFLTLLTCRLMMLVDFLLRKHAITFVRHACSLSVFANSGKTQ